MRAVMGMYDLLDVKVDINHNRLAIDDEKPAENLTAAICGKTTCGMALCGAV